MRAVLNLSVLAAVLVAVGAAGWHPHARQPALTSVQAAAARQAGEDLARLTRAFGELDLRDLDGRRWTAAGCRGRVVLLDFWATWCAPCLAEIPWLRQAQAEFGPDRLVVLGVNLDVSDRRTLIAWLNRHRVDWPQLHDGRGYNGELARRFGVTSLPRAVLFDAVGQAVALNLRGEALVAAIAHMLGGSPAAY